jgi:hypothetical protein
MTERLEALEAQKVAALERQDYEGCARLRDEIKSLAAGDAKPAPESDGDSESAGAEESDDDPWATYAERVDLGPLVGDRCKMVGLSGRPDLNGRVGVVAAFSAERGRYTVRLDAVHSSIDSGAGERVCIKPANLRLYNTEPAAVEPALTAAVALPSVTTAAADAAAAAGGGGSGAVGHRPILIIEGLGLTDANWMTDHILGNVRTPTTPVTRVDFCWGEDPAKIQRCQTELLSGKYCSVIIADLAHKFATFRQHLGEHLQVFVRGGGAAAFITSEGGQLQETLRVLFDTTWTSAGYFRSTFGSAVENGARVAELFGSALQQPFSVKASTIRNVPLAERCFGVTPYSQHESLSMQLHGFGGAVGRGGPQDPGDDPDVPIYTDYDVVVAVHQCGSGQVAYFGDVNCEDPTTRQVAAFCARCAPVQPVDMSAVSRLMDQRVEQAAALTEIEFETVTTLKTSGNASFKSADWVAASQSYAAALEVYGARPGSQPAQRVEKMNLHSNSAESLIRQKLHVEAAKAAASALEIDSSNAKARLRHARALAEIGDADSVALALQELSRLKDSNDWNNTANDLTKRLKAKRKALDRQEAGGLRAAFAAGRGGPGLSSAAEPAEAPRPQSHTTRPHATWASGLSPSDQYEWFTNCYQMRCDDEYVMTGDLRGPYNPDADGMSIATNFLAFCLLAARNQVVPAGWDWAACLHVSARFVRSAFEKSDAKERWGGENVFSFSRTSFQIYGRGPAECEQTADEIAACEDAAGMWDAAGMCSAMLFVSEVGGVAIWEELLSALGGSRHG